MVTDNYKIKSKVTKLNAQRRNFSLAFKEKWQPKM
jgi:hypothetical protein